MGSQLTIDIVKKIQENGFSCTVDLNYVIDIELINPDVMWCKVRAFSKNVLLQIQMNTNNYNNKQYELHVSKYRKNQLMKVVTIDNVNIIIDTLQMMDLVNIKRASN